jgi:hypothetical protein
MMAGAAVAVITHPRAVADKGFFGQGFGSRGLLRHLHGRDSSVNPAKGAAFTSPAKPKIAARIVAIANLDFVSKRILFSPC